MTAFEELGVMPEIGKAVDEMGWMLPTDIQVCRYVSGTFIYIMYFIRNESDIS